MTVTTDEAAEIAGVASSTIRTWVLRGDLKPLRRGAKPLTFWYEDVAAVQQRHRSKTWSRQQAERHAEWLTACADQADV